MDKQKIIFLVDDSSSNLKVGSDLLSQYYTVYTLDSGKRLFKILERIRPNIILLDINMPEMDGYEVLQALKANPAYADIPVVFLTAYNSDESEVRGFELGALDYITKPFSAPRLLKRIENQLLMEDQRHELLDHKENLEGKVTEITAKAVNLKNAFIETMTELAEHRILSGGHIFRTQAYVRILLTTMQERGVYAEDMAKIDIRLAVQSSQLHDIGKIFISEKILSKPAALTREEFEEMKEHTAHGVQIIDRIQSKIAGDDEFLDYGRIFAESHHEKWNGAGYHNGRVGEDIPLLGRVMAIADVYDALVTRRSYKEPLAHIAAVEIIQKDAGTHFDPKLVEIFMEVHHEFEAIAADMS